MSRLDDAINKLAYQEWPEDWVDCGNSGVKHEQNYSRRLFFIEALKSGHTIEVLREVPEVKELLLLLNNSKPFLEEWPNIKTQFEKTLNKWNKGDGYAVSPLRE